MKGRIGVSTRTMVLKAEIYLCSHGAQGSGR
jgi:hypothetical protein